MASLPSRKKPSNSWGYDRPGTRGGLTWTDGAPELTEALPLLWRSERAVDGTPAVGAAVSAQWSEPVVVGRYGSDATIEESISIVGRTACIQVGILQICMDDSIIRPSLSGGTQSALTVPASTFNNAAYQRPSEQVRAATSHTLNFRRPFAAIPIVKEEDRFGISGDVVVTRTGITMTQQAIMWYRPLLIDYTGLYYAGTNPPVRIPNQNLSGYYWPQAFRYSYTAYGHA